MEPSGWCITMSISIIIAVASASPLTTAALSTIDSQATYAASTSIADTVLSSSTSATTMVAFPVASPSTLPTASTTYAAATTPQSDQDASGLSQGARAAIYATTIAGKVIRGARQARLIGLVGGTLLVLTLIWVVYRRRVRRRNLHRRRVQQELEATSSPRKRLSVFGAGDMTETSDASFWCGDSKQAVPAGLAERFRRKDAYIKATLGDAYPMHMDLKPEEHSKLLPASPPKALSGTYESNAMYARSRRCSDASLPDIDRMSPLPSQRSLTSDHAAAAAHLKRPPDLVLPIQRWSWTNSQAPPTPRMYVPTLTSSRNSVTRLRMAVNWVKTQGERITSAEAPTSSSNVILPKAGVLKNQASKPNLAPKKLVKKNSVRRTSRVSDLERG